MESNVLVHYTALGILFSLGAPPLVRASASLKIRVWLLSYSLVKESSSATAATASTPLVVASAIQPVVIAVQQCILKKSVRPPLNVVIVEDLNERTHGAAEPDPINSAR